MKIYPLKIDGCFLVEHDVFSDNRGFFREWFKTTIFGETGVVFEVKQANLSFSNKNVIRGMHYSLSPVGQSKLITCIYGKILDTLIDLRISSASFMVKEKIELRGESGLCILIPSGVAHGFLSLSEISAVSYLLTSEYDPQTEKSINPFDIELAINWGNENPQSFILSDRDRFAMSFEEAKKFSLLPGTQR